MGRDTNVFAPNHSRACNVRDTTFLQNRVTTLLHWQQTADLDFTDDIALLSDEVEQAQELLRRIESECKRVGLCLNAKKTEVIYINTPEHEPLKLIDGRELKEASDFEYLGSWVNSTEGDIGQLDRRRHQPKLGRPWTTWRRSGIQRCLGRSRSLFLAPSSQSFSTSATHGRSPIPSRNLSMAVTPACCGQLSESPGRKKVSNVVLYGGLPRVGNKIAARRMQLVGHCQRHPEIKALKVVLWEPKHGRKRRGRQAISYVGVLKEDTGAETAGELATLMADWREWGSRIGARPWPTWWWWWWLTQRNHRSDSWRYELPDIGSPWTIISLSDNWDTSCPKKELTNVPH